MKNESDDRLLFAVFCPKCTYSGYFASEDVCDQCRWLSLKEDKWPPVYFQEDE